MVLTYFKRYRMEIDLNERDFSRTPVPEGYRLIPWSESICELHAEAKYLSFCGEIDTHVFPCLGQLRGCRQLMRQIAHKPGFLSETTWLMVTDEGDEKFELCGTIQGIVNQRGIGAIQNLGIPSKHRGRGIGTCLLHKSLEGFRRSGLNGVSLEVTAENDGAVRMYRRNGFVTIKTVFKAAEVTYS